jgi:hypothetical protein
MSARLVFDEDLDPAQLSWASIERWCSLLNAQCSMLDAQCLRDLTLSKNCFASRDMARKLARQ